MGVVGTVEYDVKLNDEDFKQGAENIRSGLGGLSDFGVAKLGALAEAGALVVEKAFDMMKDAVGDAANELDSFTALQGTMQGFGASAQDAGEAVEKLEQYSDGVPTEATDLTSLAAAMRLVTPNAEEATDATEAMNDMFLTAGTGTETQSQALSSLTRMLETGTFQTRTWASVMQAAPGPLNEVAQALLGPSANAVTLGKALSSGQVSTSQFVETVQRLDKTGGAGFASFASTAGKSAQTLDGALALMKKQTELTMADVIKSLGQQNISAAISSIGSLLKQLGNDFASVVKGISSAGAKIGDAFKAMGFTVDKAFAINMIAKALETLAAVFIAGKLISSISTVVGLITSANPIMLAVVAGIGLLTAATMLAAKNFGPFKQAVTSAWQAIQSAFGSAFQAVASAFRSAWQAIGTVVSSVAGVIRSVVSAVGALWMAEINLMVSAARGLASGVSAAVSTVAGWLGNLRATAGAVMSSFASAVGNGARAAWSALTSAVSSMVNGARSVLSQLGAVGRNAMNGLLGGLRAGVAAIGGVLSSIRSHVMGAVAGAGSWLIGAGRAVMEGFVNGLKSAWQSVTSFVSGIAGWISSHKGPIEYDRQLLVPHGGAIMAGFAEGLSNSFHANVAPVVSGIASQVSAGLSVAPVVGVTGSGYAGAGYGSRAANITVRTNDPMAAARACARILTASMV